MASNIVFLSKGIQLSQEGDKTEGKEADKHRFTLVSGRMRRKHENRRSYGGCKKRENLGYGELGCCLQVPAGLSLYIHTQHTEAVSINRQSHG